MNDWMATDTFWLNVTNIALGLVTLVCLLVVAGGVVRDVLPHLRRSLAHDDDHVMVTPELGLTMADGGQRIGRKRKLLRWRRRRN